MIEMPGLDLRQCRCLRFGYRGWFAVIFPFLSTRPTSQDGQRKQDEKLTTSGLVTILKHDQKWYSKKSEQLPWALALHFTSILRVRCNIAFPIMMKLLTQTRTLILRFCLLIWLFPYGSSAQGDLDLPIAVTGTQVDGDRLSANLRDVPLGDLIAGLAHEWNFTYELSSGAERRLIDASFVDLPSATALRQLLRGQSYVMILGGDMAGQSMSNPINKLIVMGAPKATAEPIPLEDLSQRLDEGDPRLLLEALDPAAFPPGIREDLVSQLESLDPGLEAKIQAQRDTIVAALLDRLAAGIQGESPSITRLRSILLPSQPWGSEPAR